LPTLAALLNAKMRERYGVMGGAVAYVLVRAARVILKAWRVVVVRLVA